jgi:uncharacterized protein YcgL (UPF0745 family)
MVNDLLGKVFGNEKPDFINSVMDVINKDNILGGHDEFIANRDAAVKAGDTRAANRWQKMADSVGDTQDIAKITKEVEAARNDPKVSQAIAKWKEVVNPELDTLYNEMKGVDPATEREGRGRVFGARVNLLPKSEEASWSRLDDPTKPTPGPSASNYRNPNAKRDKFDRAAKFTGNYSTDASAILSNVLFPRWNEVTKLRFYDDLVKSGKAFWGDGEVPEKINGEETTRLPVKVPETSKEGSTRQVEKTLVVPKSMVGEIRGVLDTDYSLKQNPLAKFATQVQLFQLTDAVSHLKNLHSVVANALGTKGFFTDIARKFPGIATGDSIIRIGKIISEIKSDSPAIRSELAFMAKNGMLREHYPATGVSKITKMQDIIHSVDTASRVTMNRFFDNLVNRGLVENTMQNRRAFVQQIGEYNKRLMSPLMRTMSRSGASPFIVAGRNFNRFSKRVISGSPGVTSSSNSSAAKMRLANVAGLTTMVAIPALINYLSTGTVWGRRGTPVGAVDLGFPEDEKGNHKVLDLLQLYGIRRGLRATGIQSVADGLANGVPPSKIVDNAISDATSTAAHPWMGPALGAGFSALTGRRLDLRGGAMPYEARKVGNDESQFAENARVTLKNQNAMIYGALRPLFNDTEESYGKDFAKDFLKGPASAIGLRDVKAPELAEAQKLAATGDQMTKEQADRAKQKRELAAGVRENPDASKKKLDDMVKSGELTKQNKTDIEKRAALSKIQYTVEKYLTPKDALQVYRMASPENKDNLRKIIAVKIFANQNLDSTEKANAFSAIQSETAKDDTLQYPPIKISLEYGGKSADFLISSGLKYEYEKLRQENLAKVRNEIESKDFYTKLPEAERTKLDASLKQRADQVSKGQFASRNFKKFIQVKP